jgi:iron(III) transport system substrate-binding protein
MSRKLTRRDVLKTSSALAASTLFADPIRAAAPPAEPVTPALIEAAKKEGKVVYYTSIDLPLAEKIAKAFEAKYPGIAVRARGPSAYCTHRQGIRARSTRSTSSIRRTRRIHRLKRDGILQAYVPEDVAKFILRTKTPTDCSRASAWASVIGYNTNGKSRRTRRRALPICSIRNGPARWSRAIRRIPAPS